MPSAPLRMMLGIGVGVAAPVLEIGSANPGKEGGVPCLTQVSLNPWSRAGFDFLQ